MRITSIFLTAAAVLFTAAQSNAAEPEKSFVHEGYTYTYTSAADATGRTVIEGRRLPGNEPFHLVVENGRVAGRSGNNAVAFRVADAKGAATGAAGSMSALGR